MRETEARKFANMSAFWSEISLGSDREGLCIGCLGVSAMAKARAALKLDEARQQPLVDSWADSSPRGDKIVRVDQLQLLAHLQWCQWSFSIIYLPACLPAGPAGWLL